METTKVIAEFLIVGTLVCLSVVFLASNIAPDDVQLFLSALTQLSSSAMTGLIAVFLPVAYGVGTITDYLGMTLYENLLRRIKEKRFLPYIEQNRKWLNKSPLLSNYAKTEVPINKGDADLMYGDMRFFILMQNAQLYSEVEGQINRARILRALTIVEALFLIGLIIHLVFQGVQLLPFLAILVIIVFLILSVKAVESRFERYCRAIERSHKILVLNTLKSNRTEEIARKKRAAAGSSTVRV